MIGYNFRLSSSRCLQAKIFLYCFFRSLFVVTPRAILNREKSSWKHFLSFSPDFDLCRPPLIFPCAVFIYPDVYRPRFQETY